jgi:hypothetical protein
MRRSYGSDEMSQGGDEKLRSERVKVSIWRGKGETSARE